MVDEITAAVAAPTLLGCEPRVLETADVDTVRAYRA